MKQRLTIVRLGLAATLFAGCRGVGTPPEENAPISAWNPLGRLFGASRDDTTTEQESLDPSPDAHESVALATDGDEDFTRNAASLAGKTTSDPKAVDPTLEALIDQLKRAGPVSAESEARIRADLAETAPRARALMARVLSAQAAKRDMPTAAREGRPVAARENRPGASREKVAYREKTPQGAPKSAPDTHGSNPDPGNPEPNERIAKSRAKPRTATAPFAPNSRRTTNSRQPSSDTSAEENAGALADGDDQEPGPTERPSEQPGDEISSERVVSYEEEKPSERLAPATPDDFLAQAIDRLSENLSDRPKNAAEIDAHFRHRLLNLAAGHRDEALRPIPGLSATRQEFWSNEMLGLATWLDHARRADDERRASEAAGHLSRAALELGESGLLVAKNLTLCKEVRGFGAVVKFDSEAFKPGQTTLLYAEVENFTVEETARGWHTRIRASYEIHDRQGAKVAGDDWPLVEEHCQRRRHDYFVPFLLTLPRRLYDGEYTLQLTLEDMLSQRLTQASLDFTVQGASL